MAYWDQKIRLDLARGQNWIFSLSSKRVNLPFVINYNNCETPCIKNTLCSVTCSKIREDIAWVGSNIIGKFWNSEFLKFWKITKIPNEKLQNLATVDTAGSTNADDREYNFQLVTSENRILRIPFKRNETIGILKVNLWVKIKNILIFVPIWPQSTSEGGFFSGEISIKFGTSKIHVRMRVKVGWG